MEEELFAEFKKCRRCGKELEEDKWISEWDNKDDLNHHYKSLVCECGKKSWVKLDFCGSGHDNMFKKNHLSVESTLRKVREK